MLATDDCQTCAAQVDAIRDVYGAGGSIDGGRVSVLHDSAAPKESDGGWVVQIDAKVAKERDTDSRGAEIRRFGDSNLTMAFHLVRVSDEWRVNKLRQVVAK